MSESDTDTKYPILSSSGVAALLAAFSETLRARDEAFPEDLKANTERLYRLLEAWDQQQTDVSEALETLRIFQEYLDALEENRGVA